MNDEESQFDELRWLVRDASESRRQTIRRTGWWAGGTVLLTTLVLALPPMLNPVETKPPPAVDPLNPDAKVGTGPQDHTDLVRNTYVLVEGLYTTLIPQVKTDIADSRADLSGRLSDLSRSVDMLDFSPITRADLRRILANLETLRSDYTVAKWLWVVDRPDSGEWRWYPMKERDTLWIPDGGYYIDLEGIVPGRETIAVKIHRGGNDLEAESWTLPPLTLLGAAQTVNVGQQVARVYYAEPRSLTAGFTGTAERPTEYIDIAICWHRNDQPPTVCSDRPQMRVRP